MCMHPFLKENRGRDVYGCSILLKCDVYVSIL